MKKIVFTFILLAHFPFAFAQDTVYVESSGKWVNESDPWISKFVITMVSGDNGPVFKGIQYNVWGKMISEGHYVDDSLKVKQGAYIMYYEDGKIKSRANYVRGEKDGLLETFYPNGQLKRTETYSMGVSAGGNCFDEKGKKVKFYAFEIFPHFKHCKSYMNDGEKLQNCFSAAFFSFLDNNLVYPQYAKENNIEGKVLVGFTVQKDGTIANIEILRGAHYQLDEAAIAVIKKLPQLNPAKMDGEPILFRYRIPINFTLR